ncbi:MAG: 1-(5-phosphoribosyl)-5-[(5-phosphoribosylamino)methylideneamino]imidazole-4-carboxamide isomerase [Phycisphaerae bacterium]
MAVELIPAIDLRGGQVVRLQRGDYNLQTTYDVTPLDMVKRFEDAGCKWLHVVDLDGAREGRPRNLDLIEKIVRHTRMKVEIGGGIRSEEVMEYLLAIGTERIILGTRALSDRDWFETMVHDARFRNRLVLGLDAKEGIVATHGWTQTGTQGTKALELAASMDRWPLAAIIYTDIARDGMLIGPNVEATQRLLEVVKHVPVIHSGGIKCVDDLVALAPLPIAGVIVGKAIYEGALDVVAGVQALRCVKPRAGV